MFNKQEFGKLCWVTGIKEIGFVSGVQTCCVFLQAVFSTMSFLFCCIPIPLQCDLITDKGLSNFDKLESIEELSLGWCRQVSDEGISILAKQPNRSRNLRVLRLARCTITDKGLQHIGVLSNLKELDLNGCIHISSAALAGTLTKLVKLNSLDVSYCPGIL